MSDTPHRPPHPPSPEQETVMLLRDLLAVANQQTGILKGIAATQADVSEQMEILTGIAATLTTMSQQEAGLTGIAATLDAIYQLLQTSPPPPPTSATRLILTINKGDNMSTFTVDTATGAANLQFADDHGDPTAGPNDSVTGAEVTPSVSSSDTTVLTVGPAGPTGTPGAFTYPLVPVTEGTVSISVDPLVNSDGSPVNGPDGSPFKLPDPVSLTITAGPAAELILTVTE